MKLSSEFIAGIAVGAGLGYVIDNFAGTAPWGMIVFCSSDLSPAC